MKKYLKLTFLTALIGISLTGCLKDKGFDNGDYGVQVIEKKAVALPQAGTLTFAIFSSDESQIINAPTFSAESINKPTTDINVKFKLKPELVDADPDLTLLPADEYSINLDGKIAAGQIVDTLQLEIKKSSNLDPNKIYALGLELVSADNGYQVAANLKEVLIKIVIKNKYDGVYKVTGTYQDVAPVGANYTARYPLYYFLVTTGPSSVDVYLLVNGEFVPAYLFNTPDGPSYYGRWGLQAFFDPATDAVSEIRNYYGDPANPSNFVGDPSGGTGAPDYISSNTRKAELDPTGINAYDAASKKIRVKYFMIQPSVVPSGPRGFFDETWEFLEPR
ncbi:MAG: DUF1735 domain-containing protein [Ferruginibacter sp.]|nr:DUF1735 domain-containing protein [Ferruginibacter sp.]